MSEAETETEAEAVAETETVAAAVKARTTSGMPRWQRGFLIATCAMIGAAIAYAACDWGRWPRLAYLPTRGELTMSPPHGVIAMIYAGTVGWGLGGALAGALVGAALCRTFPRAWPDRALHLFGAWAITAIGLAGAYYTWNLWPW